jgi:hypothetical protein
MTRLAAAVSFVTFALLSGTAASASTAPPCTGGQLGGSFDVVRGSPGAGSISYELRLVNTSTHSCFVTGIPGLQLLDAHGRKLATHQTAAHPGELTAIMVLLSPKRAAAATARFSPDVPGIGEGQTGPCEPTAYRLRVSPSGGGSLVVRITPPTPVCEHGTMTLTVLTSSR